MKSLIDGLKAIWGLFVDDEFLAIGILIVVELTVVLLIDFHAPNLVAGAFLVVATLLVLVLGVLRTVRK